MDEKTLTPILLPTTTPILKEIIPINDKDLFYLVRRVKTTLDYPIHGHEEFELNLLCNVEGARRVVGDSGEITGYYDMVLITGRDLEHTWEQHDCHSPEITEYTLQFSPTLLSEELLQKDILAPVCGLFEQARNGLAFSQSFIATMVPRFEALTKAKGMDAFVQFFQLLDVMAAHVDEAHVLSSSVFAKVELLSESRRVRKVQHYVSAHYKDELRLQQMADLVGMTPTSFSRFFRMRMGKTFTDYLIDTRIGVATRYLVDTSMSVSEICYQSGFNNVSNFNRIFLRKKGCTPTTFRDHYQKKH
ncbi:MAG: AraC family transcriptional regulator [Bacteroidales bacterium]|nr:AraC family transcriptional regulator [Bacteroidales bacterium]